ncbi:MAG: sulfite exporter TauE/SafE family protein [Proteobacteria bacterium]|nr:sulfite exporter TauE/SafE family protein [Pseudomonadota bacterium]
MTPYLLVPIIFLGAAFTQGISGFGSSLVAMPLLLLFLDVKTAVPLCVLCSLIITGHLTLRLKNHMEISKILPLFIGCVPGVFLGTIFLKNADQNIIKLLLGIMLVCYAGYGLFIKLPDLVLHRFWSYPVGFATGVISSAFSAGGPPTIIYTTLSGWAKDTIKATLSGFFLLTSLAIITVQVSTGLTTITVLKLFLSAAPAVVIGTWAGHFFYDKISPKTYIRTILILLALMGIMMIWSAI